MKRGRAPVHIAKQRLLQESHDPPPEVQVQYIYWISFVFVIHTTARPNRRAVARSLEEKRSCAQRGPYGFEVAERSHCGSSQLQYSSPPRSAVSEEHGAGRRERYSIGVSEPNWYSYPAPTAIKWRSDAQTAAADSFLSRLSPESRLLPLSSSLTLTTFLLAQHTMDKVAAFVSGPRHLPNLVAQGGRNVRDICISF